MSLDLESRLRVFCASAPANVHGVPTLEISHSAMSKVYHLWREPRAGQTTTETGAVVDMLGANFTVKLASTLANLDQTFQIVLDLVDIEDEFREQMDRIPLDTTERVKIVFREYMSDDLTDPQSVARLQVEDVSFNRGQAVIKASSPRLSTLRTGETYNPREVSMLRGFL